MKVIVNNDILQFHISPAREELAANLLSQLKDPVMITGTKISTGECVIVDVPLAVFDKFDTHLGTTATWGASQKIEAGQVAFITMERADLKSALIAIRSGATSVDLPVLAPELAAQAAKAA